MAAFFRCCNIFYKCLDGEKNCTDGIDTGKTDCTDGMDCTDGSRIVTSYEHLIKLIKESSEKAADATNKYAEQKFSGDVESTTSMITLNFKWLDGDEEYRDNDLKIISQYYSTFKRYEEVVTMIITKERSIIKKEEAISPLTNLQRHLITFNGQVYDCIGNIKGSYSPCIETPLELNENKIRKCTEVFVTNCQSFIDRKQTVEHYALLSQICTCLLSFQTKTECLQKFVPQN